MCDAGPLSSIVWANFLASGWFLQLAHSCFFSVTFFPTCPLFLFFLSLYSYCYPNELLPFFLFLFSPLVHCYFLSCYFFSYLSTVTFFPVTFFPTCPLLLSFLLPFYTPVWKTGRIMLWQCPSVRPSVRPSAFSGLFFNMLWDINLKLGICIQ